MIVRLYDGEKYTTYDVVAVEFQIPVLQIITDGGYPLVINPEEADETQEKARSTRDRPGR